MSVLQRTDGAEQTRDAKLAGGDSLRRGLDQAGQHVQPLLLNRLRRHSAVVADLGVDGAHEQAVLRAAPGPGVGAPADRTNAKGPSYLKVARRSAYKPSVEGPGVPDWASVSRGIEGGGGSTRPLSPRGVAYPEPPKETEYGDNSARYDLLQARTAALNRGQ